MRINVIPERLHADVDPKRYLALLPFEAPQRGERWGDGDIIVLNQHLESRMDIMSVTLDSSFNVFLFVCVVNE